MVARTTIKSHVIKVLSAVSNIPAKKIKEPDKLKQNLKLTSLMIKALAAPYTAISKKYGGSAITQSEAGKLKTVKASINLVHKKANTKPTITLLITRFPSITS